MDAAILIDKPSGFTSRAVVNEVQRLLGESKLGHAGTLDPLATGLLLIVSGKATRLQDFLQEGMKEYSGVIRLGVVTDTDDITGAIISSCEVPLLPSKVDLERNLGAEFIGVKRQIPPIYSAIKINGERSYHRARRGEQVVPGAREIMIEKAEFTFEPPNRLHYVFRVSKGTYVRALARDIGVFLGTGACLETIRRTVSEPFSVSQAQTLDSLRNLGVKSIPITDLVSCLPRIELSADELGLFQVGNRKVFLSKGVKELDHVTMARGAVFGPEGQLAGVIEKQESQWQIRCMLL